MGTELGVMMGIGDVEGACVDVALGILEGNGGISIWGDGNVLGCGWCSVVVGGTDDDDDGMDNDGNVEEEREGDMDDTGANDGNNDIDDTCDGEDDIFIIGSEDGRVDGFNVSKQNEMDSERPKSPPFCFNI